MNDLFHQSPEDLREIKNENDKTIQKGIDHAHEEWRGMVLGCVKEVALTMEKFMMNNVRKMVEKSPLKTHDNRAVAGVMKSAQRLGWIKLSGDAIVSKVGHGTRLQIWQSLIIKR